MGKHRFGREEEMLFALYNEYEETIVARLVFPSHPFGEATDQLSFQDLLTEAEVPFQDMGNHVMIRLRLKPRETRFVRACLAACP